MNNQASNSNNIKFASLFERLEAKYDEFSKVDDSAHNLINFYFDNIFKEIDEQLFSANYMVSDHFNNLTYKVEELRDKILNTIPDECLNTDMKNVVDKISDYLQNDKNSLRQCLSLIKEEQNISALIARKLNEYLDFKKIVLTPIKKDSNLNEIFGSLIEKDNFHLVNLFIIKLKIYSILLKVNYLNVHLQDHHSEEQPSLKLYLFHI